MVLRMSRAGKAAASLPFCLGYLPLLPAALPVAHCTSSLLGHLPGWLQGRGGCRALSRAWPRRGGARPHHGAVSLLNALRGKPSCQNPAQPACPYLPIPASYCSPVHALCAA